MLHLDDPLAHLGPEPRRLDAVGHHGQVGVPSRLKEDASLAVLDLIKLALLAPAKGLLGKIPNGCQHAADEIGIGRYLALTGDVLQQQAGLAVDEKDLCHLKGQRLTNRDLCIRDAAQARAQAPP